MKMSIIQHKLGNFDFNNESLHQIFRNKTNRTSNSLILLLNDNLTLWCFQVPKIGRKIFSLLTPSPNIQLEYSIDFFNKKCFYWLEFQGTWRDGSIFSFQCS